MGGASKYFVAVDAIHIFGGWTKKKGAKILAPDHKRLSV
jgi:hypothetical protein